jgi:hypothetical protein
MRFIPHARLWPAVCLLAAVAVPAPAAEIDKYLLDDTDGVLTLNVKQIAGSALFKKHYQDMVQKYFKGNSELPKQLKGLGIDPLKDIDSLLLVHGESSHRLPEKAGAPGTGGMFFVLHGRFDAAKVRTRVAQLAKDKDYKGLVKTQKVAAGVVYVLDLQQPLYVALPDKNTIVASPFLDHVTDALDKGTGKKKTSLKFKDVQELIDKADAKQGLWLVGTGRMAYGFDTVVAKGTKKIEKVTKQTLLSGAGLEKVTGGILVSDGVKSAFTFVAKDAASAKEVGTSLQQDLNELVEKVFQKAIKEKPFGPLREYLRSLDVNTKDKTVTIENEVDAKVFEDSLKD